MKRTFTRSHLGRAFMLILASALAGLLFCQGCASSPASAGSPAEGSQNAPPTGLSVASSFEGGVLYKASTMNVLVLNGTWREMGRQYGRLLSSDLAGMYDTVVQEYRVMRLITNEQQLVDFSKPLVSLYPTHLQQMM